MPSSSRGDRRLQGGDQPSQGVRADLEEGARGRRHVLDRRTGSPQNLVFYAGHRYAVPDRDDNTVKAHVLGDELVVEGDVARLLGLWFQDLALAQGVVGDQQAAPVEVLHTELEDLAGDVLRRKRVEQVDEADI